MGEKEERIIAELGQFTGTEMYHRSTFGRLKLTDGMHYLRERLKCFWLVDVVESVQHLPKVRRNSNFIVWKIEVDEDSGWKVSGWTDVPYESLCVYKQEGDYTDFPLKEFEFYQEGDVLLLKSEH